MARKTQSERFDQYRGCNKIQQTNGGDLTDANHPAAPLVDLKIRRNQAQDQHNRCDDPEEQSRPRGALAIGNLKKQFLHHQRIPRSTLNGPKKTYTKSENEECLETTAYSRSCGDHNKRFQSGIPAKTDKLATNHNQLISREYIIVPIIIQDLTPGDIRQGAKGLRLDLQRDIDILQNEVDSQGHRACAEQPSALIHYKLKGIPKLMEALVERYKSPTTASWRPATPPSSSGANCTISAAPTGYTREWFQSYRVHLPRRGCRCRSRWP